VSPESATQGARPHLTKNSLVLIGLEALARGLSMLVFVSMARIVGSADLGVYAFSVSLSNLAAFLPRFGFERYVQRELPRAPETFPRLWATIMAVKAPLTVLSIGGVLLALWLDQSPASKARLVLLILISTLLYAVFLFHAACFRAFQRVEYEAQVRLTFSAIYVGLGLLSLWVGWGVGGVAVVLVIASAIAVAQSTWLLHKRIAPLSFGVDWSAISVLVIESLPFFLLILSILLYTQISVVLLSFLSEDREVGIYAAAMKIYEHTGLIPEGIMGAVLPSLSRDWAVSRKQFATTFEATFRYLGMLSLPLAAGITVCAGALVRLLYGPQYGVSAGVLGVLIWSAVFSFWNYLLFAALIAMDRERRLLAIGGGGVITSVICNLLLIPRYGALGSSAAYVVTEVFLLLLGLRAVLREASSGANLARSLVQPVVCTGAMVAILSLIGGGPLLLVVPVGIGIYGAGLLATGALRLTQLKGLLGWGGQG
jgi:O-antigen/teichoic acid export membrane protein